MKEALFYEKIDNNKVHCQLCPWECRIAEGKHGVCGVRQNLKGTLYSLIYNVVSSAANDPIEKKPLAHFHPGTMVLSAGTFGCNLKCGHCQNWNISRVHLSKDKISQEQVTAQELIDQAKSLGSAGIAWTYNEPTIWFEYCLEGAKLAKQNDLYTVWITNGYINIPPLDMIGPYLDAYRVDLKAFNKEAFKKLTGGNDFEAVLKAAIRAKKHWEMHVECVTNIVPTINDDEKQLAEMANWIKSELGEDTVWHVTRSFPKSEFKHLEPTPIETLEKAKKIGLEAGLRSVYLGNV